MVKSVSWNVGVVHKLEFFYNNDSTLNYYLSGSSNLPSKYKTQFTYAAKMMDEVQYDGGSLSKYVYNAMGMVKELRYFNNGAETSRHLYSYDAGGNVTQVESRVAVNGTLKTSWKSLMSYGAHDKLNQTETYTFDENSQPVDTIIREIKELSPSVKINPYSLLHPLYQHQAHEIFDVVVLRNLSGLPVKIEERGRKAIGPVKYEYIYSISAQLLNKVKCRISIGNTPSYDTSEAVFNY